MHRPLIYPSELGRVEDILGLAKHALYGLGHLAEATIGSTTGVNLSGFGIAPTGPPSLSFTIARGSIYGPQTADSSAYGLLGTDANTLVKQGVNPAPVTLGPITPPGTSGFSQYYLVQTIFNETDGGSTVLPYFNSSNPTVPLSGPGGGGSPQNTVRFNQCVIALKAGAAAATGSETIPSPDAGYSPLYVVHVTNGQTTITSANWFTHPSAPFFLNLELLRTTFVPIAPATTFYVNGTTGNDSNDGITATAAGVGHGPFLTLQGAVTYISKFQYGGTITVNFTGTIAGFSIVASQIANWNFVGSGSGSATISAPTTATNNGWGVAISQASVTISNCLIQGANSCVQANSGSSVTINGTTSLSCITTSCNAVAAQGGSSVFLQGSITWTGAGNAAIAASLGGIISCGYAVGAISISLTATFTSAAYAQATAVAFASGNIVFYPSVVTFSGTPTSGPRYSAFNYGSISTSGSGASYIPGASAGSVGGSPGFGVYS